MSRKQGLLIVGAVAVLLGLALATAAGGAGGDTATTENFVLAVIGKAIGLFIFPGILPCIAWAFMKFRRDRLRPVMAGWILLQIVFAIASYWFDIRGISAG
jgi:hypothetical protein